MAHKSRRVKENQRKTEWIRFYKRREVSQPTKKKQKQKNNESRKMSSSRENNATFFFVCRATRLCAVTASALGNRFAMSTKCQSRRSIEKTKAVNEAGIGGWEPETSTVLSLDFFDWKELERRNYRNMSDQVKGFDVVGPELAEKETKQLEDLINWSSLLLDREEIVRCIEREAGGVL